MTDTDRVVVWLREAMDAATKRAEAAATETGSADWEYQDHDNRLVATSPPRFTVADVDYLDPAPGKFMADNDPAAVLRRIAADRKILEAHPHAESTPDWAPAYGLPMPPFACETCHIDEGYVSGGGNCDTILALAEGYGWTEEAT